MGFPAPVQQAPSSPHLAVATDDDRYSAMSPSALPAPLFAKAPTQGLPPSPKIQASPKIQLPKEADMDSPTSKSSPSTQNHSIPTTPGSPLPANVFQGLMSEQYPNLLLPPNALPLIDVKVFSSRLRPSRHSLLLANPMEEDPVFLLGIYSRSSGKQLWRVEKTIHSLPVLHQTVKGACDFDGKLPEKGLFSGHAPAKIDARRAALNAYFDLLLDTELSEKAALAVCEFFSSNVMSAEEEPAPKPTRLAVPGMPAPAPPPVSGRKEGFLTKRGKNFGGWKARYFILDGPELKYYDTQNGPQVGVIKLHKAQIGKQSQQASHDVAGREEEADNQYRHAFLVLEPKKKDSASLVRHVLCAESDEERDAWVAALLLWVEKKDGKSSSQSTTSDVSRASRMPDPVTPKPKRQAPPRPGRADEGDADHGEQLLQGTSYENTVAGELPIQGTTVSSYSGSRGMASPSLNGNFGGMLAPQQNTSRNTMLISGPSNGGVISNTENWGMKTPVKEKKRSIFGFHRARTPSDTTSGQSSTSSSILAPDRKAPLLRPVFGMPLAEAVETAPPTGVDVHLPAVVYRCIEYLAAQDAAHEEGIFRLSGSQTVIKGLRERFNNEGDVKLLDGSSYFDVHAVASLLKLYLRELPSSVLTRDYHLDFLKSLEIEERDKKIAAVNVLVHMLPRANLELLSNLCSYLADIANASDVNKMNVRNGELFVCPDFDSYAKYKFSRHCLRPNLEHPSSPHPAVPYRLPSYLRRHCRVEAISNQRDASYILQRTIRRHSLPAPPDVLRPAYPRLQSERIQSASSSRLPTPRSVPIQAQHVRTSTTGAASRRQWLPSASSISSRWRRRVREPQRAECAQW
jgi:RalA-binding protein 1